MRINNKGFGLLPILILVVIVGLVAVTFMFVTNKKDIKDSQATKTINSFEECAAAGNPIMESFPEQCAADGKTFVNPNQHIDSPQEVTKYLEIKEWGIRFKLVEADMDAYYHMFPDRPDHVYLSLLSIKDVDHCAADETSVAALSRFVENDKDPMDETRLMKDVFSNAPRIGQYYYYVTPAQAACADDVESETQVKASDARKAFSDLVTSLEAIPAN